jgi:hypothetical protein
MNAKTTSTAIIGALLVAAVAFYLRREPPPRADEASADRSAPHETEAIPAEPQNPTTAEASNDTPPRDETANPPGAPLPQASAPAPITEATDELKLPPIPEILETERAFADEAVDSAWAQEAEAHILGEIAQTTGLKLVTLRVECRTRLCRLHMAQQELSRENRFPDLVGRVGLKPLWVIVGMDRNGVPSSIAYLERE